MRTAKIRFAPVGTRPQVVPERPGGMSDNESVDAAETSPFVPGGIYELWVTGRNSAGDGPASNKINWTAPV